MSGIQLWPGDPRAWVAREAAEDAVLRAEERGAEMMLRALGVHSRRGAAEMDEVRMVYLSEVHARAADVRESWEILMERRECPHRYDDGRCLICGCDSDGNAVSL